MPRYSNSAWKPVRASAVVRVAVPNPLPADDREPAAGAVVGGRRAAASPAAAAVVAAAVGPAWSFSVNGVTSVGVQSQVQRDGPVADGRGDVPGVNTTGVPVPDRVKVAVERTCWNGTSCVPSPRFTADGPRSGRR